MNDTITTPEMPSLTTARNQPQTLEKSTAAESDPVIIEPQPDSIRDLPASLVNANEQQALSQYPHPHPEPMQNNEEHAFDATEDAVRDLKYAQADSSTDPYVIAKIGKLEAEHDALVKAFAELQAKLARHFPALF